MHRVTGHVCGDWGVHKDPNGFAVSHIPSGRAVVLASSEGMACKIARSLDADDRTARTARVVGERDRARNERDRARDTLAKIRRILRLGWTDRATRIAIESLIDTGRKRATP